MHKSDVTVSSLSDHKGLPPSGSIVVATLVCTDTVNSTGLIERCGDKLATQIFVRRDFITRKLAAANVGRELDRTDGFLLMFERPVDAVRFALSLHDELVGLGRECGEQFRERIGIHLGEIILFQHSADEVAQGAKPVEADGMAKHLCSRLMSLASGGQTLISQGAFDLARRASVGERSFNEDAASVQWLAHGPYRLDGLEDLVDVFEVGRVDRAPLSAPPDSLKARRLVASETGETLGWRPSQGQPVPGRASFVLQKRLGLGGFGEVWLARHAKTRDARVFKFCFQADHLRALKREVTLLRVLKEALGNREDIAKVFDWRFDEPPYYIELEYAEGGDLVEWARAQGGLEKLPLSLRLEIVAQAAEALAAAHSVGVLHKDIKPTNLLMVAGATGVPHVRLTDFGIGLITDRDFLLMKGITASGLTEVAPKGFSKSSSGSRSGTRLYQAPELLEGKPATIHSDIYSLGVMLYQITAGDLTRALALGWERDIPDELLREDIASCVDRDPERRTGSARDLAERLRNLEARAEERRRQYALQRESKRARESLRRANRRRRVVTLVAALAMCALLAVSSVAWRERSRAVNEGSLRRQAESAHMEAQAAQNKAEYQSYWATMRLANVNLAATGNLPAHLHVSLDVAPSQFRSWEHRFLSHWATSPIAEFPSRQTPGGGFSPAFSSSGTQLLAVAPTGDVVLNDIASGRQLLRFKGKSPALMAIFSPDEQTILTTEANGTAVLWDAKQAVARHVLELQDPSVSTAMPTFSNSNGSSADPQSCVGVLGAFFPDGSRVCVSRCDGSVAIFNTETGDHERDLKVADSAIRDLSVSPDGQRLLVLQSQQNVPPRIYDLTDGRLLTQLATSRPPGDITDQAQSAKFHPVTGDAVIAYLSTYVLLWDTAAAAVKQTFGEHAGIVRSARFSGDGRTLFSGSNDGTAISWDLTTSEPRRSVSASISAVEAVGLDDSGKHVVTVAGDSAKVWEAENPTTFSVFKVADQRVRRVRFSPKPGIAALACGDGAIRVWDFVLEKEVLKIISHDGDLMDARFSPDGKLIASAGDDLTVGIWNSSTGEQICRLAGHTKIVNTVAFSPDSKLVASASSDGSVRLWDVEKQTTVSEFHDPKNVFPEGAWGLRTVDFLEDGQLLVSRYMPPGVTIWNWKNGSVKDLWLPIGSIPGAVGNQSQNMLVCASRNNAVYVYPLDAAESFATEQERIAAVPSEVLYGHRGYVQDVGFSPDKRRVASVGQDGTIRLWNPERGHCTLILQVPPEQKCWNADFSADGRFLAAGTNSGDVLVWDAGAQ